MLEDSFNEAHDFMLELAHETLELVKGAKNSWHPDAEYLANVRTMARLTAHWAHRFLAMREAYGFQNQ